MALFSDDHSEDVGRIKRHEKIFLILFIISMLFFITAFVFLTRYFLIATQTTKTINGKIDSAVKQATTSKENELKPYYEKIVAEEKATPWTTYQAEDVFGAFTFKIPKDWRTSQVKNLDGKDQLRFFADTNWVSYIHGIEGPYTALEVKITNRKFDKSLLEYQEANKTGKYKIEDAAVSNISGKRLQWKNPATGKKAVFIIVPYRDKTLYIGTEKYDEHGSKYEEILKTFVLSK